MLGPGGPHLGIVVRQVLIQIGHRRMGDLVGLPVEGKGTVLGFHSVHVLSIGLGPGGPEVLEKSVQLSRAMQLIAIVLKMLKKTYRIF